MACSWDRWGDTEEFARLASSNKMPVPRDLLMSNKMPIPRDLLMAQRAIAGVEGNTDHHISPKLSGGSDEPRRADYHLSCLEAHP